MATTEELKSALEDYCSRAAESFRVQKGIKGWSCVIYIESIDTDARFTITVNDGVIGPLADGLAGTPDLVIGGNSEDMANIFWGDENPSSNYMKGAITVKGSQDNLMRLDAMAMFLYMEAGS